jgi:choice-of-anchor B domain-containing protein
MHQPVSFFWKNILALTLLAYSTCLFSQKQLELMGRLEFPSLANDVWGYTAPDGTEYALVGLRSGVSIVSLADPASPLEIQFIPGDNSTWRDLKTWGHFAYVTTDQPGTDEGLLIVDLSGLPNNVTWENWRPVLPNQTTPLHTCHNLWIDEFGYCYLSGCDQNSGGVIILDVFSTPGTPQFVTYNAPVYAHDCFTQNNQLYTAEIYEGTFSVFDVTDKQAIVQLATQNTPFEFCHNVWANEAGTVLFTTDERANAPTAAFDISNMDNIKLLDEFRPTATLGTGVIPHNAHVLGNYVVISNYTDGCVVVDATRPDNLIEVESYDTSTDFDEGFHGCWGAYPYFPSGLIAASDIENGLYILKPNYPSVAYLEGKVTDGVTGQPISGVKVEIQSDDANFTTTSFTGNYKTGQASSGSFLVKFNAKGYFEITLTAELVAGEVTILNAQLGPLQPHNMGGTVLDEFDGKPIPGAAVRFQNEDFNYETLSDVNGHFAIDGVLSGTYEVFIGKWGYRNLATTLGVFTDDETTYNLARGYEDDFNNDLGWVVDGTADNGIWVQDEPLGTRAANQQLNPSTDSPFDAGNSAYVTGNTGIKIHDDQVDKGYTRLASPPMDLHSRYIRPMLSFDYWWYNVWSNNTPDDSLTIEIKAGDKVHTLLRLATDTSNVQEWTNSAIFDLKQLMDVHDGMVLYLTTSDSEETPNIVEAGIDNFRVFEGTDDGIFITADDLSKMRVYPNPSADLVTVDYKVQAPFSELRLEVVNVWGQVLRKHLLQSPIGSVVLDTEGMVAAPYFIYLRVDGKISKATKLIKVVYGK